MTRFIVGCMIAFILLLGVAVYFSYVIGAIPVNNPSEFAKSMPLHSVKHKRQKVFFDRESNLKKISENFQANLTGNTIGQLRIEHEIDVFLRGIHRPFWELNTIHQEKAASLVDLRVSRIPGPFEARRTMPTVPLNKAKLPKAQLVKIATSGIPESVKILTMSCPSSVNIHRFSLQLNQETSFYNKLKVLSLAGIEEKEMLGQKRLAIITSLQRFVAKILHAAVSLSPGIPFGHFDQQMAENRKIEQLYVKVVRGWSESWFHTPAGSRLIQDSPTIRFTLKFFGKSAGNFPAFSVLNKVSTFGFLGNPFSVVRPSGGRSALDVSLFRLTKMQNSLAGETARFSTAKLDPKLLLRPSMFKKTDNFEGSRQMIQDIECRRKMMMEDLECRKEMMKAMSGDRKKMKDF